MQNNNQRSETILRKLRILLEFIIDGYNLSYIRYANEPLLMADTEKKTAGNLRQMVKESEN